MTGSTEDLIGRLSQTAGPVRRLRPPLARALIWLGAVSLISALAIGRYSDLPVFMTRASDPRMALELAATLATGLAGVIAAFFLSVPDRSRQWAWLPAPFVISWIGLTGLGCYRDWGEQTAKGWRIGESSDCFVFILATGLPLAGLLIWGLRRAAPLQPRLVAVVGAVGISGLSAFLLQFFHPFNVTLLDGGWHVMALTIVFAAMRVPGTRMLNRS